jgi:hypothetical protein
MTLWPKKKIRDQPWILYFWWCSNHSYARIGWDFVSIPGKTLDEILIEWSLHLDLQGVIVVISLCTLNRNDAFGHGPFLCLNWGVNSCMKLQPPWPTRNITCNCDFDYVAAERSTPPKRKLRVLCSIVILHNNQRNFWFLTYYNFMYGEHIMWPNSKPS